MRFPTPGPLAFPAITQEVHAAVPLAGGISDLGAEVEVRHVHDGVFTEAEQRRIRQVLAAHKASAAQAATATTRQRRQALLATGIDKLTVLDRLELIELHLGLR